MKTFREWLVNEMPLSAYRTRFSKRGDRRGDSFQVKDGVLDTASQVDAAGKPVDDRFSHKDRRVITHPRTIRTLEQRLAHAGYNFNILMVEGPPNIRGEQDGPARDRERYQGIVRRFVVDNDIQTEGHITFAKNSTSGHLLTPWMILHTLGHAVADHAEGKGIYHYGAMQKVMAQLPDGPYGKVRPGGDWRNDQRTNLGHVLMFRSVQNDVKKDSHASLNELTHELVAEYLWNGGEIRIRPPYDKDEKVYETIASAERIVEEILDSCVGHIVYDHE